MIIQNATISQTTLPLPEAGSGVGATTAPTAPTSPVPAANQPTGQVQEQQPSHTQVSNAVNDINSYMQQNNQSLRFSMDTTTGTPVVQMVDTATGQVVRQIPSKAAIAIAESIDQFQSRDTLHGQLIQQKA